MLPFPKLPNSQLLRCWSGRRGRRRREKKKMDVKKLWKSLITIFQSTHTKTVSSVCTCLGTNDSDGYIRSEYCVCLKECVYSMCAICHLLLGIKIYWHTQFWGHAWTSVDSHTHIHTHTIAGLCIFIAWLCWILLTVFWLVNSTVCYFWIANRCYE